MQASRNWRGRQRAACVASCVESLKEISMEAINPDSKIHGDNMGATWVLSAPDGLHVGPMNLAIREFRRLAGARQNLSARLAGLRSQVFSPLPQVTNVVW